ncbi:MAG: triple tyrosine motif-containing protein [Luteibacter sp.]
MLNTLRPWCLLLLMFATQAAAGSTRNDLPTSLNGYYHTAFLRQNGGPGSVYDMAETTDGYLWLATSKGITRYDGQSFVPFVPLKGEGFPDTQVERLFADRDGGLWVASAGGATLLKNGHLTTFGKAQGYVGLHGVFFHGPGGVWSRTAEAVMKFTGTSWQAVYPRTPEGPILSAAADPDGNLWIINASRFLVLPAGSTTPHEVAIDSRGIRTITFGASGRVYVYGKSGLRIFRRHGLTLEQVTATLDSYGLNVYEHDDGSLWMTSPVAALKYASPAALATAEANHTAPIVEMMTNDQGLTDNYTTFATGDSRGDVWVATSQGLDRFRPAPFTRIPLPKGIHTVSAAIDGEGNAWVGSETHPLLFLAGAGTPTETPIPRLTVATFADRRDGTAWAAGMSGVWQLLPGAPKIVMAHKDELKNVGTLPCMLRDRHGGFYTCQSFTGTSGLLYSRDSDWKQVLNHPVGPWVLSEDASGNVWTGGREKNRLYRIVDGSVRATFGPEQGLALGGIRSVFPTKGGLWVGGDHGVQWFDGTRFSTLALADPALAAPVCGLVVDAQGNLWVQSLDAVLRITVEDLTRAARDPSFRIRPHVYTEDDGVPGDGTLSWTHPGLRLGPDGRIWIQTDSGLGWIDPARLRKDDAVPQVHIDGLESVGTVNVDAAGHPVLSSTQRTLRIRYTSPALDRADTVRFRYRLVGLDDAWQDVGHRREATFTNLSPGAYRFEVVAISGAGVQSRVPAVVRFQRQAAFYETWWFRAAGLLPIALLLWLVHSLRARAIARRLRIRSDEREAVARDIHDTLLQRLNALTFTLTRLADDPAIPPDAHATLEEASRDTRQAIAEGRDQITSLRRDQDAGLVLYDKLLVEGRQLQARYGVTFAIEATGVSRPLKDGPAAEVREVVLEAMRNAFAHAEASNVRVLVDYEDKAFWVIVVDDGNGVSHDATERALHSGHFGLKGMRERMAQLKGTFQMETGPGEGTEIHLSVPAKIIYAPRTGRLTSGRSAQR